MAKINTSGNETSLKQIFQGLVVEGIEFLQGTVISASPLKIQIANDEIVVLADRAADVASVDAAELRAEIKGFEDQLSVLSESDAHRAYLYNEIAWCKLLLAA